MSVYIKGLEMPKERESFQITIKYNGLVFDTETGIQIAEAHEVSDHGDLIEREALKNECKENAKRGIGLWVDYMDISLAPTIIPANKETDNA